MQCSYARNRTAVCVLANSLNPETGAVFVPVRNDTVTGLLVTGFPGNGVFGYGTVGLSVTRVVAVKRRRLRPLPPYAPPKPVRPPHLEPQTPRRGLCPGVPPFPH